MEGATAARALVGLALKSADKPISSLLCCHRWPRACGCSLHGDLSVLMTRVDGQAWGWEGTVDTRAGVGSSGPEGVLLSLTPSPCAGPLVPLGTLEVGPRGQFPRGKVLRPRPLLWALPWLRAESTCREERGDGPPGSWPLGRALGAQG